MKYKKTSIIGIALGSILAFNTAEAELPMNDYVKCFKEGHADNVTIDKDKNYKKGEVIIGFNPNALGPIEVEYFINSIGYKRKSILYPIWNWLLEVPEGKELEIVNKLYAECLDDIIDWAELNYGLELRKEKN